MYIIYREAYPRFGMFGKPALPTHANSDWVSHPNYRYYILRYILNESEWNKKRVNGKKESVSCALSVLVVKPSQKAIARDV